MKILFIHGHMINQRTWRKTAQRLAADGIEFHLTPQWQAVEALEQRADHPPDVLLCDLYRDLPDFEAILQNGRQVSCRASLSDQIPAEFSTLDQVRLAKLKAYLAKLSLENYHQGMRYLASLAGLDIFYEEMKPVRTHGIYHPLAPGRFSGAEKYFTWLQKSKKLKSDPSLVGLLCYFNQLAENNAADVDALILALEEHGLVPICVFCEGMPDASLPLNIRHPWYGFLKENKQNLCVLINLQAGRLVSQSGELSLLVDLDVPVFQGLRLHGINHEKWLHDPQGMPSHSMIYSIAQPEISGTIEPALLATDEAEPDRGGKTFSPVAERIELLCKRIKRWQRLQQLPNAEKRITIVLHNNPCKGVEATVGMAVGMDVMASLGRVVAALRAGGYDVAGAPENGEEILRAIQERKAHGEFRWTTADEIARKGGDIHRMTRAEYQPFFEALPDDVREKLVEDWGEFPGQGMVLEGEGPPCLLITGLVFGKLKIMVQPKRGCYGPKCTGEVCRILHDPNLSPPHHWLATYKYIQDTSDVVIHFGAEGALEYLPGKRAALSASCFPEISLGDLPNLYVYCMDIPGEGLIAKRRGRAVVIDHLTPVYCPVKLTQEAARLEDLLNQYQHAEEMGENLRLKELAAELPPLLKDLKLAPDDYQGDDLSAKLDLAKRQIASLKKALAPEGMHVLGKAPDARQASLVLASLLKKADHGLPALDDLAEKSAQPSGDDFQDAAAHIRTILEKEGGARDELDLSLWCQDLRQKLDLASFEIDQLLKGLDGRYMEANLGGSLLMGQTQALPSGRNFYAIDVSRLPSRAAWKIGCELADDLLRKYLRDEENYPRTVGVSLWSSDAFKSYGEVLCQILHLMGARPVWEPNGRVSGIEPIALEELELAFDGKPRQRPRIDVVVQTSSILRDMVPNFIDLVDQAAVAMGDLEEPEERNYIRKHTRERMAELAANLGKQGVDLRRLASFRVFSSAPGAYGLGVELALDASAWEDEKDLAEVFINWGGHAYGAGGEAYGVEAQDLLASNLQNLDVSYMRQFSPEYDLMDCGGYACFQGGMTAAARAEGSQGVRCYFGAGTGSDEFGIGDLNEEIETALRSKLLNPAWLEHMKKHGHQGAEAVSARINHMYKWSATTGLVEQRLFEAVMDFYVHNEENLEWLRQTNPYASEELTRRLLEGDSRGLWKARDKDLAALQSAVLAVEGDMEDAMGQVTGEYQGAQVEILTSKQVEKWNPKWRLKSKPFSEKQ